MSNETIRAIVINPTARTITEINLPTEPGNPEECYGTQVKLETLYAAIGCEGVEMFYLDRANHCVVDGESLLDEETPPTDFWQYGANCEPIAGIGVITGHDLKTDTFLNATLSLAEVRNKVKFTKRIVRGMKVSEGGPNISATLVAPIVEEC